MKTKEAINILSKHNEWRRGAEIPMTEPKILGEAIDAVVSALSWHNAKTEKPVSDTFVVVEVEGYEHTRFVVAKWDGEYWLHHLPKVYEQMPTDGWFGFNKNVKVKRWRYIE